MHVHYLISPGMASTISKRLQSRAPHAASAHLPRLPEVSACLGVAWARSAKRRRKGSRLNTTDGPVQGAVRRGGLTAKRVDPDRGEGASEST